MRWTCEENTAAIQQAIIAAANAGAAICAFPELAVTGFHRQIASQATPALVQAALRSIQRTCAERSVAVAVGAPTHDDEGNIYNSHVHINERGEVVAAIPKKGLTPSEATFFAPGEARPFSTLAGRACTSVLCREVEDAESVRCQLLAGKAEIVFWPSLIGRPPADPPDPTEVKYLPLAQSLACQSKSYFVQSNWPNSLNYPEQSPYAGASVVVAPNGEVLFALPGAEAGLAVFVLGERSYEWSREET